MISAATFINPVIKIVTIVAVLGAIYLFVIKPMLDTATDVSDRFFDGSGELQQEITKSLEDAGMNGTQFEIPASSDKAQKLAKCVRRVQGNTAAMQRCVARFGG